MEIHPRPQRIHTTTTSTATTLQWKHQNDKEWIWSRCQRVLLPKFK
jgi:hypothetical protein